MSDWNDVLAVLEHEPAIRSWTPLPGTTRAMHATIATPDHGEITMIIENSANENWLQLLIPIAETTNGAIWENAGRHLRHTPAIGLTQHGEGIAIRHGILLPHTNPQAIINGITLTTAAATTLFDTTTHQPNPTTA